MSFAVPIGASYSSSPDYGRLIGAYGHMSVKEVISTTSGLGLAQLVATRAAVQLQTLVDARRFCRLELVPPGGGMTHIFQQLVVAAPTKATGYEPPDNTQANFVPAQDMTLAAITATMLEFPVLTFVSDVAQRQAAVNLAEVYGIAHGNAINYAMNLDIYNATNGIKSNTTNKVTLGVGADGKSYTFTWANLFGAIGLVQKQRGRPDFLLTHPWEPAVSTGTAAGFYQFILDNIGGGAVTFTTALADYLKTGQLAEVFGLRLFVDQVYSPGAAVAAGTKYAHVGVSNEAEGWAQGEDIIAEIQRWAPSIGYNLVTHSLGKSTMVLEPHVASIEHA